MAETEQVSPGVEGERRTADGAVTTGNGAAATDEELPQEIQQLIQGRGEEQELSLDEIFELLKNERRREVIKYLLESPDGRATLSDLAELIAAKENDIEIRELSSDQRKRVYVGLYQCHLPKMDDMGVIDFESNRGTVELNSSVAQLQPYLERINDEPERQLPVVELSITLGVLAALIPAFLGVGPIASLAPVSWAVLSTTALVVVAAYQLTASR